MAQANGARFLFLIECTGPHWIAIGRELLDRGWKILLWTGAAAQAEAVRALSSDIVYAPNDKAVRAVLPFEPTSARVLDGPMKERIATEKQIALEMMDRLDPDGRSMSFRERSLHFDVLANQWLRVLDDLRPDAVVFSMAPHIVYDYVLYAVARLQGLPTPMFDRSAIAGRLLLLDDIYDARHQVLRFQAEAPANPQLEGDVAAELDRMRARGAHAFAPTFAKKVNALGLGQKLGDHPYGPGGFARFLAGELRAAASEAAGRRTRANYIKLRASRLQDSWPSLGRRVQLRLAGALTKRKLWGIYEALVSRPEPETPYVYFALHFQPERATCPMAWNLGDQITVAAMLATALPPGWKLVVKEHPWQLQPRSRGEYGRSGEFYERLAAIPNVHLAPIGDDSNALTRGARAVVTATGSAGWEAICNSVPALLFGSPWYAGAPGVHPIRSSEDCVMALAAVQAGARPEPRALERFLWALQRATVWGTLEPLLETADISTSEAAASMADALHHRLLAACGKAA